MAEIVYTLFKVVENYFINSIIYKDEQIGDLDGNEAYSKLKVTQDDASLNLDPIAINESNLNVYRNTNNEGECVLNNKLVSSMIFTFVNFLLLMIKTNTLLTSKLS